MILRRWGWVPLQAVLLGLTLFVGVFARHLFNFEFSEGLKLTALATGAWFLLTVLCLSWWQKPPAWAELSGMRSITLSGLAVFVGWVFVSAAFAENKIYAFWGSPDRMEGALHWLLYLVVGWIMWQTLRDPKVQNSKILHALILLAIVLQASYAIAQSLGIDISATRLTGIKRVVTTLGLHNTVCAWIWLSFFYVLTACLEAWPRRRVWGYMALGCVIGWAAVASHSRAAWIGGLLGLAILFLILQVQVKRLRSLLVSLGLFSVFGSLALLGNVVALSWYMALAAGAVGVGTLMLMRWGTAENRWVNLLSAVLGLLAIFALYRVVNSWPWACLAASLLLAGIVFSWRFTKRLLPFWMALLALWGGIQLGHLATRWQDMHARSEVAFLTHAVGNLDATMKGESRVSIWMAAGPWAKDHLCWGSGPQSVELYYPQYRLADQIRRSEENLDRLHNMALDWLVTLGLPGLLIFYGWLVYFFYRCLKALLVAQVRERLPLGALLAGIFSFYVQGLFLFGFVAGWLWLFFFMLLLEARLSEL